MKRTRNRRMYVNLGARASRLFRAEQLRRKGWCVRVTLVPPPANEPVNIIVHPGVEADVAAQFARLDEVIDRLGAPPQGLIGIKEAQP